MRTEFLAAALCVLVSACAGNSTTGTPDAAGPDPSCDAQGRDASLSCIQPCSHGNSLHVGEFCTFQGGQCDDNLMENPLGAYACTADYDPTSDWFCTRSCSNDSQCGEGAKCTGDPGADGGMKGCVPTACL